MELSSTTTKRTRIRQTNVGAQVASCSVDGCDYDLTKCRDYHRRHRVCELHSKTPTVTIRGQEQRFCQQCSKFHSLSEFDDGKRSCRKRLDGHNRRRRKPQPDSLPLTAGCFLSRFAPSSMFAVISPGHGSWPGDVEVESDSPHYGGRHHQILKLGDQDATTCPGSAIQDLRTQPQYRPATMSSHFSSDSSRRSPSIGINRAIASWRAFSLLSPSSTETPSPVKCFSRPIQPEPSTSAQRWISPGSQLHKNMAENPPTPMLRLVEYTNDAAFHHQGLYHQDNIGGICSSSPNHTFSWV